MGKKRNRQNEMWPDDLFDSVGPVFPVKSPTELQPAIDFSVRLAQAISRALKKCPHTREQVAAEMATILGEPVSRGMLDAYASPGKEQHRISLVRYKALARATGALWLWEIALDGEGLTLLEGEQARLAEMGALKQQMKQIQDRLKTMERADPVSLKPIGRRG